MGNRLDGGDMPPTQEIPLEDLGNLFVGKGFEPGYFRPEKLEK
jgi:hypothetical protein